MQYKRLIAKIASIQELNTGEYFASEGWNPNFIKTKTGKVVHRANIMGTIITEPVFETNLLSFMIDDGTGRINVRIFDNFEKYKTLKVGDAINTICRPREFNNEIYIVPDIIKPLKNPLWLKVRCQSIQNLPEIKEEIQENTVENKEEKVESGADGFKIICDIIKERDKGDGADYEDVVEASKLGNADKVISMLIQEGEIFEFTPGKLKLLN